MLEDIGVNIESVMRENLSFDAIHVQSKMYKYENVYSEANKIRHTINNVINESSQFVGILCYRSISAYTAIAGTLFSKNAFLPLNPFLPNEQLSKIISISGCKVIILASEAVDAFVKLAPSIRRLTVICPHPTKKIEALQKKYPQHTYILPDEFSRSSEEKAPVGKEDPAYLMFTSGSTGDPKGIAVSHKNLHSTSG